MPDQLVRVHLKGPDLLVVAAHCTETAQRASELHRLLPTSAGLLGQALAAAYGVAGLLAGRARVNLQVTCDGPLQGLFADADAEGNGRGYVKNGAVHFLGPSGVVDPAAFGTSGTLSVLRELRPGEFYRGSVPLEHRDLGRDLERYYRDSEQLETRVSLPVFSEPSQPIARVAALFVQRLPGAAADALPRLEDALARGELLQPLASQRPLDIARAVADLFDGSWDLLAEYPLAYSCGCSRERVLRAVRSMGREEIADMLAREGRAVATCAFCNAVYEVSSEQLQQLLAAAPAGK